MNFHPPGPFGPIPCFRADPTPTAELPPVVLVLQEIFGVNPYIRGVCAELAAAGFVAVAIDLFHRNAPNFLAGYDEAGFAAGRTEVAALDLAHLHAELGSLVNTLRADPSVNGHVGVLGFCYGGLLAWETHALHTTDAAVSYYGRAHSPSFEGVPPIERTPTMKGPLLAHFASSDPSIPHTAVGACAEALVKGPVRGTIEVWPRTHHGFHCWDRASFDPYAASRSWAETVAFLRANLKG
ncbi:MAG: dienelactone hydrolase family protein [Pseudomonadota bacterium]|nr:dienelactone hydrolase family protein [Pseudomonadota bacterium]